MGEILVFYVYRSFVAQVMAKGTIITRTRSAHRYYRTNRYLVHMVPEQVVVQYLVLRTSINTHYLYYWYLYEYSVQVKS